MVTSMIERKKESTIEAKFVATCRRYGGEALKFTSPGRRGVPDRLVQWPGGVTTYAELKRPGEDLSPAQVLEAEPDAKDAAGKLACAKRMRDLGMVVFVVHNDIEMAMFISASLQKVVAV